MKCQKKSQFEERFCQKQIIFLTRRCLTHPTRTHVGPTHMRACTLRRGDVCKLMFFAKTTRSLPNDGRDIARDSCSDNHSTGRGALYASSSFVSDTAQSVAAILWEGRKSAVME
jgi:hypothetical protein